VRYAIFLLLSGVLFGNDFKFGARLDTDFTYFETEEKSGYNLEIRRARVFHKGSIENFFYETEFDFADEVSFKDFYFGYDGDWFQVKAGNIKIPFSLQTYSSSKYSPFMEDSLVETFTENRKLGSEISLFTKFDKHRANLFFGLFENSIDEQREDKDRRTRSVVKTTYGYKFEKGEKVHFGISYMHTNFYGDNRRYKHKSEIEEIENRLLNLNLKNIDSTNDIGFETLYLKNSFYFQAEYLKSYIDKYELYGFYSQVGYFLFGGKKKFSLKEAKFNNPKNSDALEIALRYSKLDLTDIEKIEEFQEEWNLALNWHIDKKIKLLTNYSVVYPNHYVEKFYSAGARLMLLY
jgi:phosphate-selective porin OprO/OprP